MPTEISTKYKGISIRGTGVIGPHGLRLGMPPGEITDGMRFLSAPPRSVQVPVPAVTPIAVYINTGPHSTATTL